MLSLTYSSRQKETKNNSNFLKVVVVAYVRVVVLVPRESTVYAFYSILNMSRKGKNKCKKSLKTNNTLINGPN